MNAFITVCEPPEKRAAHCTGGKERHLTEAAVMIAFAMYLLDTGAAEVEIHPDGEHGKRYDIRACLESLGFTLTASHGTTRYGGVYRRGHHAVSVSPRSGFGDVVAKIGGNAFVAECKGGITNTDHAGQVARLRRGLCEAVGQLMVRPAVGERNIAVVPETPATKKLAERMRHRTLAAGIEIALVDERGRVEFIARSEAARALKHGHSADAS